jgi:ABC-2 type transport system permease protein
MRVLGVFRKSVRELRRDPLMLSLTLIFAPLFVLLYTLFFPTGSTSYAILVLNRDAGATGKDGLRICAGDSAVRAIEAVRYADGKPLLVPCTVSDSSSVEKRLRDRDAVAFVAIPADFSRSLLAAREGRVPPRTAPVEFGGDLTNPYYRVGGILAMAAVDAAVQRFIGTASPVRFDEKPLGASAARTEFEMYVPGLLVFAAVLLVFLAAMTVAREVEAGTLRRLRITRMSAAEFLGGTTATLVIVGTAAAALTFGTALLCGFRSQGPLGAALLVTVLTSVSVIGVGLVVACFSKTVSQAFVIANFPLALLMFFTGAILPLPKIAVLSMGGRVIGLFDGLPPTHAVAALNKIFTLGAGFGDVAFEIAALALLSILYFALGVWLFGKFQMRSG